MSDRIRGISKSEAVEKISRLLSLHFEHGQEQTVSDLANALLNVAEKEIWGRPPSRNADLRSSYGYATVYSWEPES
jgi:hypothetical protein